MGRTASAPGRAALQREESLSLHAYPDQGGVWTIGYGHTGHDVIEGTLWSHDQALAAFDADVAEVERWLHGSLHVDVTQDQFDALVSLAYNEGGPAIAHSTLLRMLNTRAAACIVAAQFGDWIYSTVQGVKQINPVLVHRRIRELLRFLGHV